jgi:hypothetical protein
MSGGVPHSTLTIMRFTFLLPLFIVCTMLGCRHKKEESPPTAVVPWDTTVVFDVIPAGDGGIYFTDNEDGLWYSRGATAMRLQLDGVPIDEYLEVIPSSGKGVYLLRSKRTPSLLYAEGGVVRPVREVNDTAGLDSAHGVWGYAVEDYLKRREAWKHEQRLQELEPE